MCISIKQVLHCSCTKLAALKRVIVESGRNPFYECYLVASMFIDKHLSRIVILSDMVSYHVWIFLKYLFNSCGYFCLSQHHMMKNSVKSIVLHHLMNINVQVQHLFIIQKIHKSWLVMSLRFFTSLSTYHNTHMNKKIMQWKYTFVML